MEKEKTIIEKLQEGKLTSFINFHEENKADFLVTIKEGYHLNAYQASDILNKSTLIVIRYLNKINPLKVNIDLRDIYLTVADRIITRDFKIDDMNDKVLIELIEEEINVLDNISEELVKEKNNLDDMCRKLLILIYYQKFPLNKVSRIMGMNEEDELLRLKEECLSGITLTGD